MEIGEHAEHTEPSVNEIDQYLEYPLNGEEITDVNPGAKMIPYTDLNQIKNIDDLFVDTNRCIILYLLQSETSGHWTCLWRIGTRYYFFDSYGQPTDIHLDKLGKTKRKQLDVEQDKLRQLLKGRRVTYNNVCLQDPRTQTCGMHVTARLHWWDISDEEYINRLIKTCRQSGLTPDQLVARYYLLLTTE